MIELRLLIIAETIIMTCLILQTVYLLVTWYRSRQRLALIFAVFSISLLVWAIGFTVDKIFIGHWIGDLSVRFEAFGWTMVVALFSVFVLHFTRHKMSKIWWAQTLLFIPGAFALFALLTGLPPGIIYYTYSAKWGYTDVQGIMMHIYIGYSFILMLFITYVLVRSAMDTKNRRYRLQLMTLAMIMFFPYPFRIFHMLIPVIPFDPTTLTFTLPTILFFYEMYALKLFSNRSVAREAIFENQSQAVMTFDTDDHFIDINANMKEFLTVIGISNFTTFSEDWFSNNVKGRMARPQEYESLRKFIQKKTSGSKTIDVEMDDTKSTTYEMTAMKMRHKDGTRLGTAIIVEDVTEKRALQRSVERYNRKLKKVNKEIKGVNKELRDSKGQLERTNEELELKVHERTQELREKYNELNKVHHELTRAVRFATVGMVAGQTAHEILNPITAISGKIEKMNMGAIEDMEPSLRVLNKISKDWRKDYEAGGIEALMEKESQVHDDSGKKVIELDLDSMDEVYRALHRTIEENIAELDYMDRELKRVVWIIDKLRFLSRTKPNRKTQKLPGILDEVSDIYRDSLKNKHIAFNHTEDGDIEITVDRGEFLQMMINLVRNAIYALEIKYTDGGGTISIDSAIVGGDIHMRVSDDGMGIDLEYQDHIFEPDFTTKDEVHGTGMGLSIVQDVLESYGGSVELEESTPGRGTTFLVRFPLDPKEPHGISLEEEMPELAGIMS